MSMTLCTRCGCFCDTDLYPEGYYHGESAEPSDEYYCETCNQEEL